MQPLPPLVLDLKNHRDQDVICFHFPRCQEIFEVIRFEFGAFWSQTMRCWYIPYSPEITGILLGRLTAIADVEHSRILKKQKRQRTHFHEIVLPPHATTELDQFARWLHVQRYSGSTIHTYKGLAEFFLKYLYKRNFDAVSERTVAQFNYEFIVLQNKSISYQNQAINAIKQFLRFRKDDTVVSNIERPRTEKKLPVVLSVDEVRRLLTSATNLKHKTLLSMIYSGGFRVSEILNLKPTDIDHDRMLIHIKSAKGNKDRYTLLSTKAVALLKEYTSVYEPKVFLFEGINEQRYSERAAQNVLKITANKANIRKKVTLHTLRHSFATHLLEQGTDIRYIQNLLGHQSPKTTMIYTHVTAVAMQNIKNPFDLI